MIPITPSDYVAVGGFPLSWRWMDARWNVLPQEHLERVRPLNPAKAGEVFARRLEFLDPVEVRYFRGDAVSVVSRFNDAPNEDDRPAREWLAGLPIPGDPTILVTWEPELAVLTDWSIFRAYWNDFCYPFDQVVVWPDVEGWVVLYHPEELLYFGMLAVKPTPTPDRAGG